MTKKKYKNYIYTPLVIFLSIAIGLLLGRLIYFDNSYIALTDFSNTNKLSTLISFIHEKYVDSVSTEEIVENIIPEILSELDPHSIYIPAEIYAETTESLHGSFDGIGVQFNIHNDTIMIVAVIPGGPSEEEGLLAGDKIVTIDDSLFAGKKITNNDVIKNLKGEKGSKVKLGIMRSGIEHLVYYTVTRDKIPLYSVDVSYMVDDKIGYIKISRFAQTTHDEFVKAVNELKANGLEKIIIDLRGNSGGYLGEAYKIVDEFLEKGKMIVYTEGKAAPRQDYLSSKGGLCVNMDVIILIDTWSASASEIVAGAIQDNDRGLIIGRRSYGKGLVQNEFGFKDGSFIRLTIARYYTPTGRCIQKPYMENNSKYEHEIYDRLFNGELAEQDTTLFVDSLKYKTPAGRTVYGGGGIMPDIFVSIDTVGFSEYYKKIAAKNYIHSFSFDFANSNRSKLNRYTDDNQIISYLESVNILQKFIAYTTKKKLKPKPEEIKYSNKLITNLLYAFIIRNILEDEFFYKVYNTNDKIFLRAVEEMKK